MPRIRQYAERDLMKDFIAEINAQCGRYNFKSQRALADAIGVCQATVGNYLKKPENIPLGTLRSIVKVLRPNPEILLKVLGYSTKEIQKLNRKEE